MDPTPSIAQRMKLRKLLQEKVMGRKPPSTPKYVDLDDESETQSEKDKWRSHGVKNPASKNRTSNKEMHYGSSEHCDDDIIKCGEAYYNVESDDSSNDDERELEALDDSIDNRRVWIPRADGIEMLYEKKVCDFRIKPRAKSRNKKQKLSEESKEHDRDANGKHSGQSDSEPEIQGLNEVTACGLWMDDESRSRSNNEKRTINPVEHGQQGMGYENLVEEHIFEGVDVLQGEKPAYAHSSRHVVEGMRKENSGDEAHCHSLVGKNFKSGGKLKEATRLEKNTSATDGEDEMKFFTRTNKKWSKVEKTLGITSFDSSHDSSSSSDTENDDPDDEDFMVEKSISSVSEESCSSIADEGDEEDSSSREVSGKSSDEKGNPKEKSCGKKRRTCGRGDGICGDHVDCKTCFENASHEGDEEDSSPREVIGKSRDEKANPKQKSCGKKRKKTYRRGDGICRGDQVDRKHESNNGCHHQTCFKNTYHEGDEEDSSSREVIRKSRDKKGNSKEKSCGKKRKRPCGRGDGICRGDHVDRKHESNSGCHHQTCFENTYQEGHEGDEEDSSSREVNGKSRDEKGNPNENSSEKKKERNSGRGDHVDCKHGSNSGCHHETCFENTCNKTMENFKGEEIKQLAKKEKFSGQKQNDLVNVLINSIIGKGEMFEEQTQQAKEPEEQSSPSDGFTLPKKFSFEDDEPKPVEKSEHEKMVEALFDELVYADMCTSDPFEDDSKREKASNVNGKYAHACSKGNHDLYINEEIGLICHHCYHVEREIKDMDPEFATNVRRTWSLRSGDREKLPMFNGLDFSPGEADFGDPFNASKGTVWDAIPGARSKMFEHQQEGFEFLWKNLEGTIDLAEIENSDSSQIGGCIISHAPGTGKTLLTIVFICTYLKLFPSSRPVIIAPASMLLTWEEEFRKWNVDFPFHNVNNMEFSGKEHKKLLDSISVGGCLGKDVTRLVKIYSWSKEKSVLGISYNLYESLVGGEYRKKKGGDKKAPKENAGEQSENFRKILSELPRLVVLDEGHTPRNHRSCIWNTLLKLQTKRKIILSGTPFQNNFAELFNTLRLVRPATAELLAKEKTFADMITARGVYSQRQHKQMGTCYSTSRDEAIDKAIEKLKAAIAPFVHVHKGNILQRSLPGLKDSVILLNPRPLQRRLIKLIENHHGHSSFKYDHEVAIISTHPSLLNLCCLDEKERAGIQMQALEKLRLDHREGVKTKFVIELVRLSSGVHEKVLVFSQYIQILKLMAEQLEARFGWEEGRHVIQMHGKQDQKHRQNIITKFNDPLSEAIVLLASTKCCSEGINLVGASRVVLLDVVWNPSVERQAISRAYRLGQQKVVHTYHLMAAGTSEADKYCRQVEKDRLSELVFSSTTKENVKQQNPASAVDDVILQKMIDDVNFKDMFEKIIYQPKEANLITSFALASASLL